MLNGEDIRIPKCLALPFAEAIFHRAHFDSPMASIQHETRRRYKNRNWKQKIELAGVVLLFFTGISTKSSPDLYVFVETLKLHPKARVNIVVEKI